jgi:phage regulator Rha-like protein
MPKPSFISAYKKLAENKLQKLNMRILNIVYNAEIKYQQHLKLRKYRHIYFRSNFDLGKNPQGENQ